MGQRCGYHGVSPLRAAGLSGALREQPAADPRHPRASPGNSRRTDRAPDHRDRAATLGDHAPGQPARSGYAAALAAALGIVRTGAVTRRAARRRRDRPALPALCGGVGRDAARHTAARRHAPDASGPHSRRARAHGPGFRVIQLRVAVALAALARSVLRERPAPALRLPQERAAIAAVAAWRAQALGAQVSAAPRAAAGAARCVSRRHRGLHAPRPGGRDPVDGHDAGLHAADQPSPGCAARARRLLAGAHRAAVACLHARSRARRRVERLRFAVRHVHGGSDVDARERLPGRRSGALARRARLACSVISTIIRAARTARWSIASSAISVSSRRLSASASGSTSIVSACAPRCTERSPCGRWRGDRLPHPFTTAILAA